MSRFDNRSSSRSEYFEALEDISVNPSAEPTLGDVINARFERRALLKGALGAAALGALAASPLTALAAAEANAEARADGDTGNLTHFDFSEIAHGVDQTHHVAPGYSANVLIRWGDPVVADAPVFDPGEQSAEAQLRQFGYNNDFIGYIPLPCGSDNAEHGLLCINHEYSSEEVMFPGLGQYDDTDYDDTDAGATRQITDVAMACHGGSVIEVKKENGRWMVVPNSQYARRITALDTEMTLSGPAAGHARLKTAADPSGSRVIGTINNCAGGITPWGTYLMAEENFHFYFIGTLDGHPEQANYARYGIPGKRYPWGKFHPRFDINTEPNEPNRFGWIVEVDPLNPTSTPVKRTALGRFKHEGAESIVNGDGRLVIYSGDDQRFEYLYKFVTNGKVDPNNRTANRNLLDDGGAIGG